MLACKIPEYDLFPMYVPIVDYPNELNNLYLFSLSDGLKMF